MGLLTDFLHVVDSMVVKSIVNPRALPFLLVASQEIKSNLSQVFTTSLKCTSRQSSCIIYCQVPPWKGTLFVCISMTWLFNRCRPTFSGQRTQRLAINCLLFQLYVNTSRTRLLVWKAYRFNLVRVAGSGRVTCSNQIFGKDEPILSLVVKLKP